MLVREFHCPKCRRRLRIDAGLVGPRVRCPKCDASFGFPAKAPLALGKARRPELFVMVMGRSKN